MGNFITQTLAQSNSNPNQAFVYHFYSSNWTQAGNSSILPVGSVDLSVGLTLAYELSHAVEKGFDSTWLNTSEKLLKFFVESSAFQKESGIISHLYTNDQGVGLGAGTLYSGIYAEACRTFIHFAALRSCPECFQYLNQTYKMIIEKYFIDALYSGWYEYLDSQTFQPLQTTKAHSGKVGLSEIKFYSEALRLSQTYFLPNSDTEDATISPVLTSNVARNWVVIATTIFGLLLGLVAIHYYIRKKGSNQGWSQGWSQSEQRSTEEVTLSDVESEVRRDFL